MDSYHQEKLHHTPWIEKYRPKNLSDVSSQDQSIAILKQTIKSGNLPHMLFYGPPGTGKTSTILALAKELFGPNLYKSRVLELNASDERGISIVREKIKNFARLQISNPTVQDLESYPCPPFKIIILDEADSMTNDAQSALRRIIENYSNITRFVLICNYITRIIDPLASRCSKFRFKLLNSENSLNRLRYISDVENLNIEEDVLMKILSISQGDLRKAITYLQSSSKLSNMNDDDDKITIEKIEEIAGVLPDKTIDGLVDLIMKKRVNDIVGFINDLVLEGWSIQQLIDQLHDNLLLDDKVDTRFKNQISLLLLDCDKKLNNGTDEHIQLLNLVLQISKIV
ncbi:unnamed protein product [Candida verbasci]|uniref:Replication factor C subunit 2 n=1 Tax=Candida verbasci TaxID=1227364 RepID=A0A9W4XC81_9ASCO|nr:unnamed protein product [Candida verbasci]